MPKSDHAHLNAHHIMSPRTRLVTVTPDMEVADAISLLLKHRISGMPVEDEAGNYVGVFSEKCCLKVLQHTANLVGDCCLPLPRAKDFMVTRLIDLHPEMDVFQAIEILVRNHISGAPVTDQHKRFLGSFSEKTSMSVLIHSVMDGLPTANVERFMDRDPGRLIHEDTTLLDVAEIFIQTPYRRLPIVAGERVIGQISRRDVLRSSRIIETILKYQTEQATEQSQMPGDQSTIFLNAHSQLPSTCVAAFMDTDAKTVNEETDLLTLADVFLNTPYRRFPVLRDGKIVGQVHRQDVLEKSLSLIEPESAKHQGGLYISAITGNVPGPAIAARHQV